MKSHTVVTTARAKEVLAQYLEHGNGHESRRGMGASTQCQGMTGSQTHGHGSQSREHQEHQEHRR